MSLSVEQRRSTLVARLADGQFHSGESLGRALGVSRAAVNKHIQALTALGLDVYKVTGKGYRLSGPLTLLEESQLATHRQAILGAPVKVMNVVDSTNTQLKCDQELHYSGAVCVAQAQTAGRGRMGRQWLSPFGANLYLSMFWCFGGGYSALQGLSLMVGLVVSEALDELGYPGTKLKWPNDVYLEGKKLGGILIEVEGQMNDECQAVIGLGLNLDMPDNVAMGIDQPWTDLTREFGQEVDKNRLAARIIDRLHEGVLRFEEQGLTPFQERWNKRDHFAGQSVRMLCGKQEFQGICLGINQDGALILDTKAGQKTFFGGEVSVRPL
ncbi:Biotin--[acetyl-CoA-carboxylase] ligase [Saliniradius amylolyticus]|uniref:Bifunctional ligase/repressor BirA n=1 Tax=Saliniradius amylolyticus TaxID=2183582 RepID=A0A2S2DZU3_9ALTE|nr:bifunctional biotin--[acetyl-CoA-carboxylase] ligase/biotin operon repressor BirA [Saliniradius amylolyticus]AWL10918.1 Biotin--[acetyl-CoA-carboxylase] ligase [Saliniradius amylolyticus]